MAKTYSLIGPNLFMDTRGKLFAKTAGELRPVQNKYMVAEDRFVRNQLSKGEKKA